MTDSEGRAYFSKKSSDAVVCPAFRERTFGGIVPAQGGVRRYNKSFERRCSMGCISERTFEVGS